MKIKEVTTKAIIFDNGNKITYDHDPDCCEHNYADFSNLNPNVIGYNYDFEENLEFKWYDKLGFTFGDSNCRIFIPCYSEQNGYYSTDLTIFYNDIPIYEGKCQFLDEWCRY